MGKKSAPPAPDYTGAAREQAAASLALADKQTAENRPNIYTPWGSQTWSQNGDQWTMNLNLSPNEQAALDDQQRIQAGRSSAANQLLDQATSAFQTPVDYSSLPQGGQTMSAPQLGGTGPAFGFGSGGGITDSFSRGGIQSAFSFGGPIQSSVQGTSLPSSVNFNQVKAPVISAASASAGPLKFEMDRTAGDWRQKAQDAALQFMRPGIDRRRSQLESQLANMGLARGSEAWNAELQRDSDQATRDELQAFGAGQSEANMLFNQDLAASDFTNRARGQEFSQNFANAGLQQQTNIANANLGMQAQLSNNDNLLRSADFGLRSGGQLFGQNLAQGQFANQAQQQEYNQNQGAAAFANQAQQQDYTQALGQATFGNQAQNQGHTQNLGAAQFYNNAQQQADQRAQSEFGMGMQANNYNQALRQALLNERLNQRSQPLNELNALLTGQQVQNPNMPSFNAAGKAEAPQLLDAANMGYQGELDAMNSARGMFGQLASAGIMAGAMMFSDIRLKEGIEYTGDSIGGVPVVHYRYRGLPGLRTGVIAQDVLRIKPRAVVLDPSGYLAVNYSELCA